MRTILFLKHLLAKQPKHPRINTSSHAIVDDFAQVINPKAKVTPVKLKQALNDAINGTFDMDEL